MRGNFHEIDHLGVAYSADMELRTYWCMKWQLTGFPYVHAVFVIVAKKD